MRSPVVSLVAVLAAVLALGACGRSPAPTAAAPAAGVASLSIHDLKPGEGPAIAAGQTAVVHYTGWLYESAAPDNKGKQFDSSRDGGKPFSFVLGAGQVIDGWDRGVAGMKAGGERRLVIPPELGYGSNGAGSDIPPGATLVFDVELLSIR